MFIYFNKFVIIVNIRIFLSIFYVRKVYFIFYRFFFIEKLSFLF